MLVLLIVRFARRSAACVLIIDVVVVSVCFRLWFEFRTLVVLPAFTLRLISGLFVCGFTLY